MTAVEPPSWTGRSLPRVEDPSILRGHGRYVADVASQDRCWYAKFVRSSIAAGRIVGITAPPGVRIYTAADLDGVGEIVASLARPDFVTTSQPILARDVVRFVGEPVAMVLAETEAEAEDALERVVVEIEPLPAVLSVADATADQARLVHDVDFPGDPNTVVDGRIHTPGFDEVFAAAAHRVSVQVGSARQSAMPLEARASHAAYDPATGRTTLHVTTQMPHVIRTGLADVLGIREDDLRVIAPDVGGGFGAKMALAREDVMVVHAARRLRRNIAWIETREENFMAAWHSREQVYDVEGAFTEDGDLLAVRADLRCDVGAYSCYPVTYGVEPLMAMAELTGPYAVREYSVRSRAVLSNKCPIAPYRGVSRPVQVLAMERLMDVAARQLDIDPVDLRMRNLVHEFPHRIPSGLVLDNASHRQTLAVAAEMADVADFRRRQRAARGEGRLLGIGFSSFAERTGYGTPAFAARSAPFELKPSAVADVITPGFERVVLAMDSSAGVTVRIGASPHGQGLRTALAQVISDELGVSPGEVRVIHSDTDATPYGWGSFASRAMVLAGGASMLAARELAGRLRTLASSRLGGLPGDIDLSDGEARHRETGESVPLFVLARDTYHSSHLIPDKGEPALEATATYDPSGTFANACHVAEVEVDPATGAVAVTRFLVAEDAGRLVNPAIVDGQIQGGVVQGIANALFEELIYDDRGVLVTTSLMDYLPPTLHEVPDIEIAHLETTSPQSVTGAKGVGEGGTIGAPAAIANAVSDALGHLGIAVDHIPATPHRLRTAIRSAQAAQAADKTDRETAS
ncbi:xanthine dehydrogenase family protein molybdopterin-binding subunit [Nocardioides sp. LHD-245]|uniref:xanthine dehydrogenase family protein molybdopterin-binding subunit n=1 Tax=Nocardioides sp. LHD-245 TaxID=3051387 RepID=UPI0027DED9B9|nr:xanthine dehydrogenase family protein molybdopterin-binding subunit [Nocardioides sp. LHD-245]